jgi:tyrosine-protein phosphatase SIW14
MAIKDDFPSALKLDIYGRPVETKGTQLSSIAHGPGFAVLSAIAGMEASVMRQIIRLFFGVLIGLFLIVGPIAYSHYRQPYYRNFRAVKDGVLYRSAQLSLAGLEWAIHDHGLKTVITLRDSVSRTEPPPDWEEEEYCWAQGINYYRISPRSWSAADGAVPAEEGVRKFLEIMDNPDLHPVLVHCYGGIHRTGAFTAVYRMEYDHWTNQRAIEELRANGYTTLEDDWNLLEFLEDYQPRWVRQELSKERGQAMRAKDE